MNEVIKQMIGRYQPKDLREQKLALQEILQEIALVGLWRGSFFEHAAFYGGTALRILYGLDRFSEDLDFTLHTPVKDFKWDKYKQALITELNGYGFEADFDGKQKSVETSVQSAFLKTNTNLSLLTIGIKKEDLKGSHPETIIKIKVEIDTMPFTGYRTQQVFLRDPIPIPVTAIVPSDLFACKLNAALFRAWKNRVKGRDWYDVVWFIRRGIPLNLTFFSSCLQQFGQLEKNTMLTEESTKKLITDKLLQLDLEKAKADIRPFVKDPAPINVWSNEFFLQLIEQIKFEK